MDNKDFTYRVIVVTLAGIILAVVIVMLAGLFDMRVDNKEIFAIIGPSFSVIIGAFVGILSAKLGKRRDADD